jgi:uncharacterized protein
MGDVGITLGLLYVAIVIALYFLQDALIFPGRSSQGRPESALRLGPGYQVVELRTPGGERVTAVFGSALSPGGSPLADAASRPTILYFYGNGQYLAASIAEVGALRRRGLNVLMPDYLGYGLSGGKAGEAGCLAAADAAYEHLLTRSDIDPSKILFGGFSMGGAVAIDLASRRPSKGVIVSCTFTSLTEMAGRQYPFIPVKWLLRHRFRSLEKIGKITAPILIADGELDTLVPAAMSDRLASAAGGKVTRIAMKAAGHDDLVRMAQSDPEISDALDRFLSKIKLSVARREPDHAAKCRAPRIITQRGQSMLHADMTLARRHERAAMAIESEYARSHAVMSPDFDVAVVPIADGVAIFAGVNSPMSQSTGLGLDGPVTEDDLEALEAVYHSRGAAARIVVCPLADDSLFSALNRRGYRLSEFEQVMIRALDDAPGPIASPGIEIVAIPPDDGDRYIAAVGPNFTEDGILPPDLRDMMKAAMRMTYATSLLARVDGKDAGGGSLLIHEGVAMLAGASTLPQFRNRGVQTTLLSERLRMARKAGCDLAVMGAKPGSASQRNAERRGFRVAYTKAVMTRDPDRGASDILAN